MTSLPDYELLRHVRITDLSTGERTEENVKADAAECEAIAARLGILSVDKLVAELQLFRDLTGDVNMVGQIMACVVQACVVTLNPVSQHIDIQIFQRFSRRDDKKEVDNEDPVELIVEDQIEVGDVIVQNLALALDPYPRAPEVAFEEFDDAIERPASPFAALAGLRDVVEK